MIDAAVKDLVDNQDLCESTAREYIVGYLVKSMIDAGWSEDLDIQDRERRSPPS